MGKIKSIAIVGAGPRGLSALENLYLELAQVASAQQLRVLLFEKTAHLGSGPIYRIDQIPSNWLNVSERALTLDGRPAISVGEITIPAFPFYHEWSGFNSDETQVDNWFQPTPAQFKTFSEQLKRALSSESTTDPSFLTSSIADVGSEVFLSLKEHAYQHALKQEEIVDLIKAWLEDIDHEHFLIIPHHQPPEKTIQEFVDMATGQMPVSLDYCLGQVWRHLQPTMYKLLSFSGLKRELIAAIIDLDDRMKRYAYGPPVASLQQLLALHSAGIMTFRITDDPDIGMTEKGWEFKADEDTFIADVVIDTVLDNPQILEVRTPIIQNLLAHQLIQPIHQQLGVLTDEQAYVITEDPEKKIPIAVLGRLAKGTLIGVDAILECFGPSINTWAKKVVTSTL